MQRALLIVNSKARKGRFDLTPGIELLEQYGMVVTTRRVHEPRDIAAVIQRVGPWADLVIIGGGDGTLSRAAEALVEVGRPLGILPLGTANDLARTLGIPENIVEACRIMVNGRRYAIDLGWVNGKHFFNVSSVGLSVRISRRLTGAVKRRWGVLSYAITFLDVFRTMRAFEVRLNIGSRSETFRTVQIAVGNGRFYGGGMAVAADASIDDQQLDFYSLAPQSLWRFILISPLLRSGRHDLWQGVQHRRGQQFEVVTHRPMAVNTDGEVTARTPANFMVKPRALAVFVPATGGPGLASELRSQDVRDSS